MSSALDLALRWALRGAHCFPLGRSKMPLRGCRRCSKTMRDARTGETVRNPDYEPHDAATCACLRPDVLGEVCHGWYAATTDPERLEAMFAREGAHTVGIATGPTGWTVLDLDVHKDGDPLPRWYPTDVEDQAVLVSSDVVTGRDIEVDAADAELIVNGEDAYGLALAHLGVKHTATLTVATPSGGKHLAYADPQGVQQQSKGGYRALYGADVRSLGGYIVAPGGKSAKGVYRILDDRPPAPLPEWLRALLTPRPAESTGGAQERPPVLESEHVVDGVEIQEVRDVDRYAAAVLSKACTKIENATTGQRWGTAVTATVPVAALICGGSLDYEKARAALALSFERAGRAEYVGKIAQLLQARDFPGFKPLELRPAAEPEQVKSSPECAAQDDSNTGDDVRAPSDAPGSASVLAPIVRRVSARAVETIYARCLTRVTQADTPEWQGRCVEHAARDLAPLIEAGLSPDRLLSALEGRAVLMDLEEIRLAARRGYSSWDKSVRWQIV